MLANTYEGIIFGMRHCGEWSREKKRTWFLDDITDLPGQKSVLPLEFYFVSHTFPYYFRQLGFLLLAAEIILTVICGLQTGFDPGSGLCPF